jgi:hypothetical protein
MRQPGGEGDRGGGGEGEGAPSTPSPRKITLPVCIAAKTWPSPRKLAVSTIPVTKVSTSSVRVSPGLTAALMLLAADGLE